MFKKIRGIKTFEYIKRYGKRIKGRFYIFNFKEGERSFGVIVSKKVGNSVKRNYEKRIIRELIRKYIEKIQDLSIIVIRLPKVDGSFAEKEKDFIEIIQKMHECKK